MPKRIQRKRTKGWRLPEGAICVTHPGKWGNPFDTAREFRLWLAGEIYPMHIQHIRKYILDHIQELRGHDLSCWCKLDEECHADVLLELANKDEATR